MYMYQKLKEAIGFPKSSQSVVKSWTPNNIKAIIIMRNFIFVAHHTSVPKIVYLSVDESSQDIQNNGAGGSLHNLLAQRQLSCLEEIYVDSVFMNYKGIMDLDKYVSGLVNTASRLRYYGYAENVNASEVMSYYNDSVVAGRVNYCYATYADRKSVLQYVSTGNEDMWFTKFNLRPEKYYEDSDKSRLSVWLRRVRSVVESEKEKEFERVKAEGVSSALSLLYRQDLAYADDIVCLINLDKKLTASRIREDSICRSVKSLLKSESGNKQMVSVYSKDLQEALNKQGISVSKHSKEEFIVKYYSGKGVFSKKPVQYDLEDLLNRAKSGNGIVGIPDMLLKVCSKLMHSTSGKSDTILLCAFMVLSLQEVEQCNGDISALVKEMRSRSNCVSWYVDFLLGMCGFSRKTVNK